MAAVTLLSQKKPVAIPLARAQWCEDCQLIVDTDLYCPRCTAGNLVRLQPWVDRPGSDALREALTAALAMIREERRTLGVMRQHLDAAGSEYQATRSMCAIVMSRADEASQVAAAALAIEAPPVPKLQVVEPAKPHILLVCWPTDELQIGWQGHAIADDGQVLTGWLYACSQDELRRQLEENHALFTTKYDDFELDFLPYPMSEKDAAAYRSALVKAGERAAA